MTKWQPMRTAPEDGTHVLVFMGAIREQTVAKYYGERGVRSWGLVHVGDGAYDHNLPSPPTEWTNLPKPPKTDGERA
jgi:hypothetical protein